MIDSKAFTHVIQSFAEGKNWRILNLSGSYAIIITDLSWRSWGERVTIVREESQILFNSVCDQDNFPSLTSGGRNRKNFVTFIDHLKVIKLN